MWAQQKPVHRPGIKLGPPLVLADDFTAPNYFFTLSGSSEWKTSIEGKPMMGYLSHDSNRKRKFWSFSLPRPNKFSVESSKFWPHLWGPRYNYITGHSWVLSSGWVCPVPLRQENMPKGDKLPSARAPVNSCSPWEKIKLQGSYV